MEPQDKPIKQHGIVYSSFTASKLAKGRGFDEECIAYYNTYREDLIKRHKEYPMEAFTGLSHDSYDEYGISSFYSTDGDGCINGTLKRMITAPTQQQLLDWLWAKYKVTLEMTTRRVADYESTPQVVTYHRYWEVVGWISNRETVKRKFCDPVEAPRRIDAIEACIIQALQKHIQY